MHAKRIARVVLGLALLLLPAAARAQSSAASGSIAGTVRDASGAVLPGVTVEAASPALIEKVKSVVTDGQGLYRIVDLRPGVYSVTFSLPGFATFRREGIELSANFTAAISADLKVGEVQETVTVSGETPVVDTTNVLQQRTLGRDGLDALPNTRTFGAYAMLIPGATQAGGGGEQNVGGVGGNSSNGAGEFGIHGGRAGDLTLKQEGMSLQMQGGGTGSNFSINHAAIQEVVVETGAVSADTESGGVMLNIIPREGSNRFATYASFTGANGAFQTENLSPEQEALGLTSAGLREVHDASGGFGGPIMKDKAWFYGAYRHWGSSNFAPGKFFALDPHSPIFNIDPSRPGYNKYYYADGSGRLTWQVTPKNKINANYGKQSNCQCFLRLDFELRTPEASANHKYKTDTGQVSWSLPLTNKLLFEAGVTHVGYNQDNQPIPGVLPTDIAITELSTGMQYRARANTVTGTNGNYSGPNGISAATRNTNENISMSFVTGSHSFKTGFTMRQMTQVGDRVINGGQLFNFRDGVPTRVVIFAQPYGVDLKTTMNALFAQDQWTIRRLTLNLGIRYDHFNGHVPAQHLDAGPLVGERNFPEVENAPNWHDVDPRLGAAYDLFGNGKTAIKGFVGRYLGYQGIGGFTATAAPINLMVVSANRTWVDANHNFVPDCALSAPAANGECGPLSPSNFGATRTPSSRIGDDVLLGSGARPANWQASILLQQELRPGVALNVGYFRTWFQNFTITDNLPVGPGDFDPYCIPVPANSRLPGGGGVPLCGFYDVKQASFGLNNTLVQQAENFGKQTEVFNGVDINVSARGAGGLSLQGGVSTGRTVLDNCLVNSDPSLTATSSVPSVGTNPRTDAFCHVSPPWSSATQFKLAVVVPIVWKIQTSAMYMNLPGLPLTATYEVPNALIVPTLHRNLSAGATATVPVELIPQGEAYLDRRNQLDVRVSRNFQLGRVKLQGNVDLYNVFNANYSLTYNTTYGPDWQKPQTILLARMVKLGVNINF